MSGNIGEVMRAGRDDALKKVAIGVSLLVYAGMIAYSAVHNWRLLTAGVSPDMVIWAALGVVGLELTALALPVALHFWTFSPMQRYTAYGFYALDLALVFLNVVLDYAIFTGDMTAAPAWLTVYKFFMVPATPIIAGLGWSALWLLDPSAKERGMIETMKASTRAVLADRIAERARSESVDKQVDTAADLLVSDLVSQTLGASVARVRPANLVDGELKDPPAGRKHTPALRWVRPSRPPVTYNADAQEDTAGFFGSNGKGQA